MLQHVGPYLCLARRVNFHNDDILAHLPPAPQTPPRCAAEALSPGARPARARDREREKLAKCRDKGAGVPRAQGW